MIICPKCGKSNVSSFYDTVFKTQGYYCQDCNLDFAVNDENHSLEKKLNKIKSIYFLFQDNKENFKEVIIENNQNKILIINEKKNNKLLKHDIININDEYTKLIDVIFKQFFLLDFPIYKTYDNKINYTSIIINFIDEKKVFNYNQNKPYYVDLIKTIFLSFFEVAN